MTLQDKTIKLITEWIETNEKLRKINNYLFENTELFEEKYMNDYREETFRFFAGKITRFTNDYNKLMNTLNEKEIRKIQLERILK